MLNRHILVVHTYKIQHPTSFRSIITNQPGIQLTIIINPSEHPSINFPQARHLSKGEFNFMKFSSIHSVRTLLRIFRGSTRFHIKSDHPLVTAILHVNHISLKLSLICFTLLVLTFTSALALLLCPSLSSTLLFSRKTRISFN